MAYNPNNYINGVDQRTERQKIRDEKEAEAKVKFEIERHAKAVKKAQAARLDRVMNNYGENLPKSPSPSDISNGKLRKKNK